MNALTTNWYAIQCASGKEETVRLRFDKLFKSHKSFFPKRVLNERKQGQLRLVSRPLFNGYFFFQHSCTLSYSQSVEILRKLNEWSITAPAFRILGMQATLEGSYGDTLVTPVQEEDIHLLLQLTNQEEKICPSVLYVEGQTINIKEGALKGHEALIVAINKRKGRAKVRLPFLGGERIIDMGLEAL